MSARKLYNQTFGCSAGFDDKLFELFGDNIRCIKKGGQVISMLFELPCTLVTENGEFPACYIYAAATHPDHRGKGLMTDLVNQTKAAHATVILRPAEDSLIAFYGRMGFRLAEAVSREEGLLPYIKADERLKALCDDYPDGEAFNIMYISDCEISATLGFAYSMP